MALSHLNFGKEIQNINSDSAAEAAACRRYYDDARDGALREFAWPFATKIATLGLIESDPNEEWDYSYRYPSDCIEVRRILSGARNDSRQTRVPFKQGLDSSGRLIFTDKENAQAEYTSRLDNPEIYPSDFVLAFSYYLAFLIAPRITAGDPFKLGPQSWQMYLMMVNKAKANSVNEEQPDELPQAEWIRDRE